MSIYIVENSPVGWSGHAWTWINIFWITDTKPCMTITHVMHETQNYKNIKSLYWENTTSVWMSYIWLRRSIGSMNGSIIAFELHKKKWFSSKIFEAVNSKTCSYITFLYDVWNPIYWACHISLHVLSFLIDRWNYLRTCSKSS